MRAVSRTSLAGIGLLGLCLLLKPELSQTSCLKEINSILLARDRYEAIRVLKKRSSKDISNFSPVAGIRVITRNQNGAASEAELRVLTDNPKAELYVIGEFNNWGKNLRPEDKLHRIGNSPYFSVLLSRDRHDLGHGMQYRILSDKKSLLDPAASLYSSDRLSSSTKKPMNSVFWDFEHAGAYKTTHATIDFRRKPLIIGEVEAYGLVQKWPNPGGGYGPKSTADTYRFIAESGVVKKLKELGYNAIEFLPFNGSIEDHAWSHRYLVFGHYAVDSRYGSPDDFLRMLDEFNKEGVGVVMDAVMSHYPSKVTNRFSDLPDAGIHHWKKADGTSLFGESPTMFGTQYYDFTNPSVRRFLIDSLLHMVKTYPISGIRFDFVETIVEQPGGKDFLRELHADLRAYRPDIWTNAEIFKNVPGVTERVDKGGLGFSSRHNSYMFDWFSNNAPQYTENIDMNDLASRISTPITEWKDGARTNYITNHDEAAHVTGGFTGRYPASMMGDDDAWIAKKSKTLGTLSMVSGSSTVDLPQFRLLQKGKFAFDDYAIDWSVIAQNESKHSADFFGDLSKYITENNAFAFHNMNAGIVNHVDNTNKVITILRTDGKKKIYTIINLNHKSFDQGYDFGVDVKGPLKIVLNSDSPKYGGSGQIERTLPNNTLQISSAGMHGKPGRITLPSLPAMSAIVIEGR